MPKDAHLVPLKPALFTAFDCPACGAHEMEAEGSVFPGIHIMGKYICGTCGSSMLRDLPVGFAVNHPMAIGTVDQKLYNPTNGEYWIHGPLLDGYKNPTDSAVKVERIVHKSCKRIILLNTLDFLYGHVLLKLFNAQFYLDNCTEAGLVIMMPRSFAWLVPKGVAEVWLVDVRLGEAQQWYKALDEQVQEWLMDFDRVDLGRGYAHPELSGSVIERFTGVAPYPVNEFVSRPPRVTFVLRQDRLWHSSAFNKLMYRVLKKMGIKRRFGVWVQQRLVRKAMDHILERMPDVAFSIVGLGVPQGFPRTVEDLRTMKMDRECELRWCRTYAQSQITIGVHGSNMLLPTAHAAGCVEILPYDRYENIVQDISVRYRDRMQLFLYRFVDEFITPRSLARHVISMYKDFEVYRLDNQVNIFSNE